MIPQTKYNDLVDRLEHMQEFGSNEFELAKVRTEIKKVEKSGNYKDAQELYGMLATVTWDIESIKKHYNAALKYAGDNISTLHCFTVSLELIFQYEEAVKQADRLFAICEDDIEALRMLVTVYRKAMHIPEALKVLDRLEKIQISKDDIEYYRYDISFLDKFLKQAKLDAKEINDRTLEVVDLLRSRGLQISKFEESIIDDTIFREFLLDSDEEGLIEVDSAISETLSKQTPLRVDNFLTFSCLSKSA